MNTAMSELRLSFEGGTVCLDGLPADGAHSPPACVWDERTHVHRAPAVAYAELVLWLRDQGLDYADEARDYVKLAPAAIERQPPFPYQREALAAWQAASCRGVVVLPTGSGKTFVAVMAMDARPRSTLVVVPTLDLLNQWYDLLEAAFARPIGIVGGGDHEVEAIPATTPDSADIDTDRRGKPFGMVVFDECHHLPSESYAMAARACMAPFRLGLTATPDRTDGGEARYAELVGPVVFRRDIDELSGNYLADYETQRLEVHLSAAEREQCGRERRLYTRGSGLEGARVG